jgi:hypothetical protein
MSKMTGSLSLGCSASVALRAAPNKNNNKRICDWEIIEHGHIPKKQA